ncbi:MAG TPA: type II toxin-antitoxin system VapC family toxin [Gemmatimonadaceae bacterium]|jgi:PIN domain nuclease of toxin-antitoxin system|nr:type II toxin-antitoxin system VapC family toxin [Gemmatimonadaceae bacterium]
MPRGAWRPTDRRDSSGPLLIDTHIWLWYLNAVEDAISAGALAFLRKSASDAGLLVSDMSVWELGTKAAKGKLTLHPSVTSWIDRAARAPGIAFAPVDRDILLASTQLPGAIHGDPVDRILVASAIAADIPLVTADRAILEYADATGALSACDARP